MATKAKKGEDPDFPTFHQAMMWLYSEEWKQAMRDELVTLVGMNMWTVVLRSEVVAKGKKMIKSTWAFCQKQTPGGDPTKKKT